MTGGGIWTSFVAILSKEFVHITRDRATLVIALTIPLFQLILFGFIDQTVTNVPTANPSTLPGRTPPTRPCWREPRP